MKRNTVKTLLFGAAVSAVLFTGCGSVRPTAAETAASETETAAQETGTAAETADDKTAEILQGKQEVVDPEVMDMLKYNTYVGMNNYIVGLLDNIDYYYMVVADQDDFSLLPDSDYTYGYRISSTDKDIVDEALAMAEAEPAYETLDALTVQIAEPMRILAETFNEINHLSNFAADQYAKPKEYHSIIRENAELFAASAFDYLDALKIAADEKSETSEAKMQENGELILYNAHHTLRIAHKILDECAAQGVNDYNLTELDLTTIRPLYDELAATIDAYNAAAQDKDQLMKESLTTSPFSGSFDSLLQAVEWMIGYVEHQTPLDDPSRESLGSLNHINVVLSRCVDQYNSTFVD